MVIDSLCSSGGYGLLVDKAADMRNRGLSMDEIARWVTDNRKRVHHRFFSANLKYYRKSGRMTSVI